VGTVFFIIYASYRNKKTIFKNVINSSSTAGDAFVVAEWMKRMKMSRKYSL
jgi:hypothetical protein